MKNVFVVLTACAFLLVSCGKADVVIRTDLENTRSSAYTTAPEEPLSTAETDDEGLLIYIVNASSKTFHISEECRHVKNMSEANKTFIHAVGVDQMKEMGYKPCSTCIGKTDGTTTPQE